MKAIKRVILFGIIVLALGSCKKDPPFTFVGKWNVETITINVLVNGMFKLPTQEQSNNGEVEFREDYTGTYARIGNFTWSHIHALLVVKFDGEGVVDIPALEFELTTMEPKRVEGKANFYITLDSVEGLEDWLPLPDLPDGFDWDLIFGDDGLHLSIDLECVLGKD